MRSIPQDADLFAPRPSLRWIQQHDSDSWELTGPPSRWRWETGSSRIAPFWPHWTHLEDCQDCGRTPWECSCL